MARGNLGAKFRSRREVGEGRSFGPDEFPVSMRRGARYGTLGGSTTKTLRDLIGRRVLAGMDPTDGILGLGMF